MNNTIDILMITYNRPEYTALALRRLLDSCDETMRVWVWHNGNHQPTLDVVSALRDHPRMHRFHHSAENRKLTGPTNWVWTEGDGRYVSKVDDDMLVPDGWAQTLRQLLIDDKRVGCISCWHYPPEDLRPELAQKKIRTLRGGHRILMHPWIGGSGYLMRRKCVKQEGLLTEGESFPRYIERTAWRAWINGWYYPFIYSEHMDDPRAEHTLLKCDADIADHLPLTAQRNGVTSLDEWTELIRETAVHVQSAGVRPGKYFLLRSLLYRAGLRAAARPRSQAS